MKTLYPTLCTAALLMLAACTQDPVEDLVSSGNTQSGDLPEGTFIVDYLPSADLPATRGVADGERILSLDYLLYERTDDNTYTLKKRTPISDISADTHWPLTRENMTWQQRQELKDTLSTGSKYKVVFVANANQKVWTDFQPMTGIDANDNFDDARLLLPPNGDFLQTDGTYTFYYMWTGDIDPANGYNKNTPAQMNVVLQRMVNKVEIRLADEVVQGIESAGSVDAYVEDELTNFYYSNYVSIDNEYNSNFNGKDDGKVLDDIVIDYMETIAGKTISGDGGIIESTEEQAKIAFRDDWLKPITSKQKVVSSISCKPNTPCQNNSVCVKHWLINKIEENLKVHCNWNVINSIDIIYEQAYFAEAIGFDKKYKAESSVKSPILTAKKTNTNCYIFYTYGHNENESNNYTQIQSLVFKNNDSKELFTSTCGVVPGTNISGGNRHFLLEYKPIIEINNNSDTFTKTNYDLKTVLGWQWENFTYKDPIAGIGGWTRSEMISWVNSLFGNESDTEFIPYTLTLTIPLLNIKDQWSTEEYTSQQQNNN